jgi:hypothetical protein
MEGSEAVAQLDTLTMQPHSEDNDSVRSSRTKLTIFANATGESGSSTVDVLIYGSAD